MQGAILPQLARAAGRGAGTRRPTPNFFFAVRIDDADVVRSARALQRHLLDEEARLWPVSTTSVSTTAAASDPVDRALRSDDERGERGVRAATTTRGGGAAPGGARRGLEQHMIDVETKLHATLFVVCAPTPALLARTQALCSAWAADLGTRSPAALAAFEMTVESVRCFNKGRGQFVLWAGIKDPAPLERLARDLHAWFVQHEPSVLQSITWTPFTPHATILKVRGFGRGARGGSDESPGARVLRILRRPSIDQSPPLKRQEHGQPSLQQERVLLEGEAIMYEGRSLDGSEIITSTSTSTSISSTNSASSDEAAMGKRKRERGRGGGGGRGGGQGGGQGRRGRAGRSDHEVLDEERVFGRQMVDCIELLSMQGLEAVDERGRGGYPVYGRLFLDPSRPSEYLDRAWGLPQSREARDEEVAENNVVATASSRETPDLEEEQSLD